jgi:hypothetical protein
MLKHWLIEYWWILALFLYVTLMVFVALFLSGRGLFERIWPRITLVTTCVIIILIPTMHSPGSYVNAAVCVFNLLVVFRSIFRSEKSSEPADR